jgi:DNA-binding CsgD family transcriptional regulator
MESPTVARPDAVDGDMLTLYGLVLQRAWLDAGLLARDAGIAFEEAQLVLRRMSELRLVRPCSDGPGRFEPMPPEVAEAELLIPALGELHEKQRFVTQTRSRLQEFAQVYRQSRGVEGEGVSLLRPGASVESFIGHLMQSCTADYAAVHGRTSTDGLAAGRVLSEEPELAERGVQVRTVLARPDLSKLSVQACLRSLRQAGGEAHVTDQSWLRLHVFDRQIAVVSLGMSQGLQAGAMVVRNPLAIPGLCEVFDQIWTTSAPVHSSDRGQDPTASDIRKSVARMLATGCADEAAARRLGMSLRTYRRHVASLLADLGARTRFQAGLLAYRHGLIRAAEVASPWGSTVAEERQGA